MWYPSKRLLLISKDGSCTFGYLITAELVGWLERHWGGGLGERYTKLEKLDDDRGEILEEEVVILGIFFNPLLE